MASFIFWSGFGGTVQGLGALQNQFARQGELPEEVFDGPASSLITPPAVTGGPTIATVQFDGVATFVVTAPVRIRLASATFAGGGVLTLSSIRLRIVAPALVGTGVLSVTPVKIAGGGAPPLLHFRYDP